MAMANPLKSNGKGSDVAIGDIEAQLAQLTAELGALSRSVANFGADSAAAAGDQAGQMKQQIAERARAMGEALAARSEAAGTAARERFLSAEGRVEDQVRAHPLAALGIAAGLGFVAALLAKR